MCPVNLPVLKEANSIEKLDQVIAEKQLEVAPKTYDCLVSVLGEMEQISLYTIRASGTVRQREKCLNTTLRIKPCRTEKR